MFIFTILAVVSIGQGFLNASSLSGSQDFQYSPSRMLLNGVNAYRAWSIRKEDFLLSQSPNYLPLLYFLLTPIAKTPWEIAKLIWAIINISCAFFLAIMAYRNTKDNFFGIMIALCFLSSLPVRNTIANGQHAILITLALALALSVKSEVLRGVLLALSLTKYSIGAYFVALLSHGTRLRVVILAGFITIISFVVFAIITGTKFDLSLLLSPLSVGSTGMALYPPFSWLKVLAGHQSVIVFSAVGIMITLLMPIFAKLDTASLMTSPKGQRVTLACTFGSLILAPHAGYDYVILILPFIFFNPIAILDKFDRKIFFAVIIYHWNAVKLLHGIFSEAMMQVLSFIAWGMILFLMIRLLLPSQYQESSR